MSAEVLVGDHQAVIKIPDRTLIMLESAGARAVSLILATELPKQDVPLGTLDVVEVALVDDSTSERVHVDFMGVEGATDVITFEHGEIVIGVEVARRQAEEYGEPENRELLRYLVHGLLHLAGHEDEDPGERAAMEEVQERIVTELWSTIDPPRA